MTFDLITKGIVTLLILGSLICFGLITYKMFEYGHSGLAIAGLLLLPLCGIGSLIPFIYGWKNHDEYDCKPVMIVWTIFFIAKFIINPMLFFLSSQIQ